MAERTGLEPATPGVTGRYSNQLNYHSAVVNSLNQGNFLGIVSVHISRSVNLKI